MQKSFQKILSAIIICPLLFVGIWAIAEEIEITTYYPSPYGVYEELRAVRMAIGTNYTNVMKPVSNDDLIVEGKIGVGMEHAGPYNTYPAHDIHVNDGTIYTGSSASFGGGGSSTYGKLTKNDLTLSSSGGSGASGSSASAYLSRGYLKISSSYSTGGVGASAGSGSGYMNLTRGAIEFKSSGAIAGGAGATVTRHSESIYGISQTGIGTLDPQANLSVHGNAIIGSYAGDDTISAPTNGLIVEGQVGIGTSDPYNSSAQMEVVGTNYLSFWRAPSGMYRSRKYVVADATDTTNSLVTLYKAGYGPATGHVSIFANSSLADDNYIKIHSRPSMSPYSIRETFLYSNRLGVNIGSTHVSTPDEFKPNINLQINGKSFLNGDVGVDTADPQTRLHVYTSSSSYVPALTVQNAYNSNTSSEYGVGIDFKLSSYSGTYEPNKKAQIRAVNGSTYANDLDLTFWSGGSTSSDVAERMRIRHDGNVGIGSNNPIDKLHIRTSGNGFTIEDYNAGGGRPGIRFMGNGLQYFEGDDAIQDWSTAETFSFFSRMSSNRTYPAAVRIHGPASGSWGRYLGLSHNGSNGYIVSDVGGVYVMGAIHSSDERLKKDIEPVKNSLDMINKLNGVKFEWRSDEYPDRIFDKTHSIGVIAQELEKVLPELVRTGEDGFKSVSYIQLVPVLIEAVKEQDKKIDKLEELATKQQEQIDALLNKIKL